MERAVSVENLGVAYGRGKGRLQVLRRLSFSLRKGETLALLGKSGSGKTTCGKALLGMLPPSARIESGALRMGDEPPLDLASPRFDWRPLRGKRIAMIYQDAQLALNPVERVRAHFLETLRFHKAGSEESFERKSRELLSLLKFEDPERVLDAYPFELSGGMCQRVYIALILCLEPEILIADEPTSALDPDSQREVLALLKQVQKRLSLSILLITHDIVLDLFFVGVFRWGVSGAALATAAAQMVSALLALNALNGKNGVEGFSVRQARFHRPALRAIVCLGLPVGLQSSLYPVANMMIQGAINGTGTNNIAAWALCGKLDFMIWLAADSLAAAISTFVAQNYGVGQFARVRRGVLVGTGMTASLVAALGAALYLWNEPLGRLFVNPSDHDVIPIMAKLMRFLSPLYFVYVFGEALSAAIRGAGETLRPMLLTLIATCASRVLWILFVVPRSRGLITIVASYPVSWALTAVSFAVYYRIFAGKRLMSPAEETTGSY